jgi:hypothetical protein
MNEDRNQDRTPKQQARQKHPDEWQQDLNPNHLAGQNIGRESEERERADMTAFHLRKRGYDLGGLDDNDLKQVPVLAEGTRLQQGATYVNLPTRSRVSSRRRETSRPKRATPTRQRTRFPTKCGTGSSANRSRGNESIHAV